ncbi:FKBP-type peptidyl-prolyl cis-trans isomerase SlyD [Methyloglobulus morosus KoM1]|uniref:Peptidyl-prolyl cis-trans isomerase n=1 Tax=Methyloglobulus morosus KoM1 TaxID=1116472 RepID=V5C8B1_9GAMM|nr:peptidylprolyl isomerase [Methyloglobulus morosus]ESS72968.1 FKBP-type peptidyl-prolyl cis-trans isomerase SlyD [Methyloglobulus morosus KoM1]
MQIANNTAVSIHYTLTNDAGEELDSTVGGEPMVYLHGSGNIISGLEKALHHKNVGDKLNVRVEAADAYGEFSDDMIQVVSREMFDGIDKVEVGMQFHAAVNSGSGIITVIKIDGDEITVDGNHPMAGQSLNFDVEIVGVRLATKEELSHGHIHGAGCHH